MANCDEIIAVLRNEDGQEEVDYLEKCFDKTYRNIDKEVRDRDIQRIRNGGEARTRASATFIKPMSEERMQEFFDENDSILSKFFFQHFKMIVDFGEVPPLYMLQFIANRLVSAAENPADVRSILGLSKKTGIIHRDMTIAIYVHRLILKEMEQLDERTFYGDEDVYRGIQEAAIDEVVMTTTIPKGTVKRAFYKFKDITKTIAVTNTSEDRPLKSYLRYISRL